MHYSSTLFGKELYMFWTDLSIIRSLNTVYTAARSGWNCSSILTLLAVNRTNMTNTYCCVYSVETPDDGQICPKHVEFFIKTN